jgi:sulfoacetaldehyde reductase
MKTVLITGASSGFGKATAELLAQEGYQLILCARRSELLTKLQAGLHTKVHIVTVDVTDYQAVKAMFADLPAAFREIDVVINNAGLARGLDPADQARIEDWEEMVNTNIKGLMYVTKEAINIMKPRNSGLIINIGSTAASVPYKGGNVYGASKAFVRQFSRNLRTDLFGSNLKVSNIEPGMAETEFSQVRFHGDLEQAKNIYANTRALQAEDIARTIKWIIEQPENVNIDNIEIMPIDQTFGGTAVNRK